MEDELDNPQADIYKLGPPLYTIQLYQNIGKNLIISILDLFDKNPYPRIVNTSYKKIDNVMKEIAFACQKIDRFKKEEPRLG